MKALSVQEPHISKFVEGKKTIETRTWTTKYRGSILLVGSKKPKGRFAGLAACTAELVDCRPMKQSDEGAACCELYDRAQAWVLNEVIPLTVPFKVKGQLGLYNVNLATGEKE